LLLMFGILLQLIGGSLFGVGLFSSTEAARVASAAHTHVQKYRRLVHWQLPQLFDAPFDAQTLVFHAVLSWVCIGVLYGLAWLAAAWHLVEAGVAANILGVVMLLIVAWLFSNCRSRDDLIFVFAHPVFGFVPLVIAVPFVFSLFIHLSPLERLLGTALLVPSVYLALFLSAVMSWVVSTYVRLVLMVVGTTIYTIGTVVLAQ